MQNRLLLNCKVFLIKNTLSLLLCVLNKKYANTSAVFVKMHQARFSKLTKIGIDTQQ